MSAPVFLAPNRVSMPIVGGRVLDEFQGKAHPKDGHETESWIASTLDIGGGVGLSRTPEGVPLLELIEKNPEEFLGKAHIAAHGNTPDILVKLIDSKSRLLIQAHPNDRTAQELFGAKNGKTEAWYVIAAREAEAEIMLGFKPFVTRAYWEELFLKQDIPAMEAALHHFKVRAGDVIFIPALLPHALGGGLLVAEVQQPCAITVRCERKKPDGSAVDDFTLHQGAGFSAMFDCFDYTSRTESEVRNAFISRAQDGGAPLVGERQTSLFSMYELRLAAGETVLRRKGGFATAVVLSGEGVIAAEGQRFPYARADEMFLPAALKEYEIQAKNATRLLFFYR